MHASFHTHLVNSFVFINTIMCINYYLYIRVYIHRTVIMHGISGYRMRAFLCSSVCRQGTLELCHKHALLHTPSHNVALNFTLLLPKAIV